MSPMLLRALALKLAGRASFLMPCAGLAAASEWPAALPLRVIRAAHTPAFGSARLLAVHASPSGSGPTPATLAQAYTYEPASGGAQEAFINEVDFDPFLANSVSLIGNVGGKPEIKYLESGYKVAKMSLAIRDKKGAEAQW